ncbi:hypothetical protein SAMN06265379_101790 [Saccharicrinis carchari]|uniref:Uncharacterized protein n=1 Tax=Saccharicrinis carchari TaxID=1168039 RepID=A0A521B8F6_SACCC|nr:BCD family MFS transporter [Saccharicrinis carchari]SMO43291.1 hypothetical protein SAMN06265379_101790 [Saccharicrinis carchari]
MNYSKNLQGQFKKSKWRSIFGIALIAIAIGHLLAVYFDHQLTAFNLIIAVIFIANGVFGIAGSKGYILGKNSYVKMDEQSITIKTIGKEKKALWEDIETIDFRNNKLKILPEDKKFQFVTLNYLNEDCSTEIRNEVIKAANKKGISIINK